MGSKTKNIKDIKVEDVFEVKNSLGLITEWCVLDVYNNDTLYGMTIIAQPTPQCINAAYQILKKVVLNVFNNTDRIEGVGLHPVRVSL